MNNKTLLSKHILIYKQEGETPLQAIQRLQEKYPEYKSHKIGYAGRLDPMAEGLLLFLIGDENKKKKDYENLSKVYEFEVLLGVTTDTYDLLGLVDNQMTFLKQNNRQNIGEILKSFIGKKIQPYPPFSSKTVLGKPLYFWARMGRLHEIEIPKKEIEIYSLQHLKTYTINSTDLKKVIFQRIDLVKGNFRQEEVLKSWDTFFRTSLQKKFNILTLKVFCSSGTYVRVLAKEIGEKLHTASLAFFIKRTQIDNYQLKDAIL